MNEATVTTARSKDTIQREVASLRRLIGVRRRWLNNTNNKHRKNYNEVVRDTDEMKSILVELQEELKSIEQPFKQ